MSFINENIEELISLVNEGKNKEIKEFFAKIEKRDDISLETKLRLKIYKCMLFRGSYRLKEALSLSEEVYKESKELDKPLLLIDSIFNKFMILFILGQRKGLWKYFIEGETFLKAGSKEFSSEINARRALLNYMRGHLYRNEGKLDPALQCFKESLAVLEKINPHYNPAFYEVPGMMMLIGMVYQSKGEFELALKYYKRCINYPKPPNKGLDAICLNGIGMICYQQGDMNKAIEYSERSLKVLEKVLSYNYTGSVFTSLIYYFLENKNLEKAQEYLHRFQNYIEKSKGDENFPSYKLAKALILKSSTRTRDRAETELLLKEVINSRKTTKATEMDAFLEDIKNATILLCDLYLKELHSTNDMRILDDIKPLIRKLLKHIKHSNSYIDQVYLNLFQGQLSLLQLNMGEARRYLTEAQKIAEDHSFQILARIISHEHDKLLTQMDEWEALKKRNISIMERMDLISLEETIDIILQKRGIKPPELIDEKPYLLLIIEQNGLPVFSKSFTEESSLKEMIVSKFLTEFNNFNEHIFSKGLDRATFGDYTLMMEPLNSLSVFYLFKGPSYIAKKKLLLLTKQIQNTAPIRQIFMNFHNTNYTLNVNENKLLESIISEIFFNNNFQVLEEKIMIQKEMKICLVCKGEVVKFFYICECGAIYCENCARAISDLENLCWACNAPIDYSKPVKPIRKAVKGDVNKSP
ncbi:MAG: tetratricopeptide repeat protein [Promethearchaeota archaeon]